MSNSESTAPKSEPSAHSEFSITLDRIRDFEFRVKFDKEHFGELLMDEPEPLGGDRAPNAARILAAAVGNCLSASLLFCMQKSRARVRSMHTGVKVRMGRNQKNRMRISGIEVEIEPAYEPEDQPRLDRCLELFEDFCVVTQSVRQGIDVAVKVRQSGAA